LLWNLKLVKQVLVNDKSQLHEKQFCIPSVINI